MSNKIFKISKIAIATIAIAGCANIFASVGAAPPSPLAPIESQIGGIAGQLSAITGQLGGVNENLISMTDLFQAPGQYANDMDQGMLTAITTKEAMNNGSNSGIITDTIIPAINGAKQSEPDPTSKDAGTETNPALNYLLSKFDSDKQNKALASDLGVSSGVAPSDPLLALLDPSSAADSSVAVAANMLNFGSYIATSTNQHTMLSPSIPTNLQQDARSNFIKFVSASYNTPKGGVDISKLNDKDKATVTQSADYQKLRAGAYTSVTRKSIALNSLNYAMNNQNSDSLIGQQIYKLMDINQSQSVMGPQAKPIAVQKAMLSTLNMIAYQLLELHKDNEHLIASTAVSNLQQSDMMQVAAMGDKGKVMQLVSKLQQQEKKKKK